ncbi:MAG: hypothetical protein EAZ95_10295, partial [Bacteroidetes bacterium]
MFSTLREALDHNEQTLNPRLDLGNLGLTGNEPELQRLKDFTWIDTLIFSNEWYEWNEEEQTDKDYKSQNTGSPNKLTNLPTCPLQLKRFICAGGDRDRFEISDITALKELKNLTWFGLHTNQIADIIPLKELKNLTKLYLHNNQIANIIPLKELKNLTELALANNQIINIASLKELKNLTKLHIFLNQIVDITPLKELNKLISLYISFNQITDITPLKELKNLTDLWFVKNPFYEKLPAHIKEKDGLDILEYWIALQKSNKKIREAKVVFVGEGNAGKTSLMHLLLYGRRDETTRTERIEIHTHDTLFSYGAGKEALKLHFWDFGGQEIMHATHKFFMSSRTLYVLIVDGRKNDHEALYNWVAMLQSSMGNSPVLVVANHL